MSITGGTVGAASIEGRSAPRASPRVAGGVNSADYPHPAHCSDVGGGSLIQAEILPVRTSL